ncbi:MAG: hydrophobe/amphiphile efflux-3 (HAE3) family transporter [Candidatus Nanopelagicaceae bacterium]
MRALFASVGKFVERHPVWIIAAAVGLSILAVLGASSTRIVTTQDAFVQRDSQVFRDYEAYDKAFGADPIVILVPGNPNELSNPSMLKAMRSLSTEFSKDPAVRSVVSILTLLPPATPAGTVHSVLYTPEGQARAQFASLLPKGHALIVVRPTGGLTVDQERFASDRILSEVATSGLPKGTIIAGNARLIGDITTSITKDMATTGTIAIVLMIGVLYLVFPVRRRLLALPVALVGVVWTFGVTGAMNIPLTLVTMAGLPVLIGLGVDFAIQFHNRYQEELHRGEQPEDGLIAAVTHIGPAVGIAVAASALGFITLLLSHVPAVRDFGLLLAIGVLMLYIVGLFGLNAMLYRFDRTQGRPKRDRPARKLTLSNILPKISSTAVRRGPFVVAIGLLLAVGGFAMDARLPIQTDVEKLIPANTPGVIALNQARAVLGTTNNVPILVNAKDVTDPHVVTWMADFQQRVLRDHSQVVSAESLATVMPPTLGQPTPSHQMILQGLQGMPNALRSSLVTNDHTGASLVFNITHMSISEIHTLIEEIVAEAHPLAGVTVVPGGTLTLASAAISAVTERRTAIEFIGFIAVFAGLLLIYRNWRKAIAPVLPIILVTGWSSGVMWLLGIQLNPLTAVMSALIIGIGTEFGVLLLERYWEERANGEAPYEAIQQAVSKVGQAVTASALTVAAGFGALLASSFPALREFAAVIVIDVLLALVATLIVTPPLILWLDRKHTQTTIKQT